MDSCVPPQKESELIKSYGFRWRNAYCLLFYLCIYFVGVVNIMHIKIMANLKSPSKYETKNTIII